MLLVLFTVKTETFLSENVFQPLLKWLLGDNQDLEDELNRRERDLERLAQGNYRPGEPPRSNVQIEDVTDRE